MPRSSSGTRKVARSLTTARSEHIAISRPPPWQIPLTAETTGLTLCRRTSNGSTSNAPGAALKSAHLSVTCWPRSPPGMKTSPVPVISRPASSGSASTRRTA